MLFEKVAVAKKGCFRDEWGVPKTEVFGTVQRGVATPEMKQMFAAAHPVGRIGQPDEVANAGDCLCSDGASFITGHILTGDGGYTAQ